VAAVPSGGRRTRRRVLKTLRRDLAYFAVLGPLLTLLERGPGFLVRALLGVLEPLAHLGTRRLSERHLQKVYGDATTPAERQRLARAVTRSFVQGIGEFSRALREGPEHILDWVDAKDGLAQLRHLEATLPRGFLAVTGHIGNWELAGSIVAQHFSAGIGAVTARRHPNARLNARIERLRARFGMPTYYRDESPTIPIRALRRGQCVAIVPDQDIKNLAGMFVDFLGHRAYTPVGPARLALAADVPMVCIFLLRDADGTLRLRVGDPIHPDTRAPRPAEIERLTRAWTREIEAVIYEHPEQWVWFHERWKSTPESLAARGRAALVMESSRIDESAAADRDD
jgi:KDO2-lipid IV(A) lauroyltransferase